MAKTKQIATTAVLASNPITAISVCKTIRVAELESVANYPTADFQIASPTATDDVFYRIAGESWTFQAPNRQFFRPGDIVGYIATPGGAKTFVQYEE